MGRLDERAGGIIALTGEARAKLVRHHTLHHTLNIPGMRVTGAVVHCCFVDSIISSVTCLMSVNSLPVTN